MRREFGNRGQREPIGLIPRPARIRGGLSARARKDVEKVVTEEKEPLDLSIDSLFKIPFTDISLFTPNIVESELNRIAKFARRGESVENLALRYVTGLPIRDEDIQEIKDPKDVTILNIISTTGKIKESVKELIPEIEAPDFDEKMRLPGTEVGKILVNTYREVFAEMADLTGFVMRPEQMFGVLPLLNIGFRYVGGNIKRLVALIKRSGIKKIEPKVVSARSKIFQNIKENPDEFFFHTSNVGPEISKFGLESGGLSARFPQGREFGEFVHVFRRSDIPQDVINEGLADVAFNKKFQELIKTKSIKPIETFTADEFGLTFGKGARAQELGITLEGGELLSPKEVIIEKIKVPTVKPIKIETPTERTKLFKEWFKVNQAITKEQQQTLFAISKNSSIKELENKIKAKKVRNAKGGGLIEPLKEVELKLDIEKPRVVEKVTKEIPITTEKVFEDAVSKIKKQLVKESGISKEKIDKEIGKFFSFKDKTGKSNIELSEGGSKFIRAQAESKIAAEQAKKTTVKQAVNFLDKKLIDVSGEVRRKLLNASEAGKHAVIMKDVTRGTTGNVGRIYNDVKSQIYENGLSRSEIEQLHGVIRARRTIGIAKFKDIKHPRGAGADDAMDLMADIEKNPLLFNKLQERANIYFKEMRRNLARLKDEGLIDDALHENLLKKGDYSKRQFLDKIDPEISSIDRGGNKITVRDSGLQKLKEGSESLIETDTSLMLQQVIARTELRIAKNNANKALMKFADDFPDNGIVRIAKKGEKAKFEEESIFVMIAGKPQQMFMPKEFAAQWVNSAPEITGALGAAMRWGTGSSILRASATGMNPGFAITNFAMDMSHQFLITTEYSSFFPKAFAQMGRNSALVFKDAILRRGRYIDFANEGGLMPFMTHQGRIGFTPGSIWAKMQTYAGWAGETSEIFGRLMLREQAMLNGKSAQEATWIARNYLDFSQGGSWIKFVDAGVPYLSASVQGTRGIFRAGSEAMKGGIKGEAEFVFKFAQISAASAGLYYGWKFMYPESYKDLSPHDKRNFWNIPTPYKFKDENGADRRYYFKIAKDPGQKVFALLTESLLGKFIDDKDINFEEQADAFTELIPITFNRLPPIMNAILGYAVNKDFWLNDDIWKGTENIKANREFHITGSQKTNPVFREIGRFSTFGTRDTDAELEGLSPERTKFFLQQFFTRGNLWTAIMGNGANVIFNELPESFQDLATEEIIQKQPIIKRFLGVTKPLINERERFREIERIENTKDFAIRQQFEVLSKNVIKGKNNLFELNRFIREQPISDQAKKRLLRKHRINRQVDKIKDNVAFWKRLGGVNDPESRAKIYFEFFNAAGSEVKKELNRDLNRIPGIRTEAFQIELGDLKRELIGK